MTRWDFHKAGWRILSKTAAGLVLAFLLLPLLVLIPISFTSGTLLVLPMPGYSLQWYHDVVANPIWMSAVRNSLIIAAISTAISIVLGTLAAIGIWRMVSKMRGMAMALVSIPIVTPVVVAAVAMYLFHASIGIGGTMTSLVVAHVTISSPFVVIAVLANLDVFDNRLMMAAANLGANPVRAFIHVMLPIILPGVLAGGLFAFLTSFDEIVIALFLTSPSVRTLPIELFSGIREQMTPTVAVIANLLVILAIIATIAAESFRRRTDNPSRK